MIDVRTLQTWLKANKFYKGTVDGIAGEGTTEAIALATAAVQGNAQWSDAQRRFAAEQEFLAAAGFDPGKIDGQDGPATQAAHVAYVTAARDTTPKVSEVRNQPTTWPRQAQVPQFYGEMGQSQVLVKPPYKIYYEGQMVKAMSLHEKVAPSAGRVFARILEVYGPDKINALGLNIYGGSLNVRKMRGGSSWSMHSWGIAIDWDPDNNDLPSPGRILHLAAPEGPGIRFDSGIATGSEVTVHYDPLLAKLVTWGWDRGEAMERMAAALRRTAVLGVVTNLARLQAVVGHPAFRKGDLHTGFLDEHLRAPAAPACPPPEAVAAAVAALHRSRPDPRPRPARAPDPWDALGPWRLG